PNNPKKNGDTITTLTNKTISKFLENAKSVNITASKKLTVNSSISIGSNSHLILHSEGLDSGGVQIDGDITSRGGNLTIQSGGWVDVHKNITLGDGTLNITAKGDVAFESMKGSEYEKTITAQGTIVSGDRNGFRLNNVSLNGTGKGLFFTDKRSAEGNISNKFDGVLNISGNVNISMRSPQVPSYKRYGGRTYWNITTLNVKKGGSFKLSIDSRGNGGTISPARHFGLNGITFSKDITFNVASGSRVDFEIKAPIIHPKHGVNHASFNKNISVLGGGTVNFNLDASSSNSKTSGVIINSQYINVSGGSKLNLRASGSTDTAFLIKSDLILNATGGGIELKQIEGTDSNVQKGVVAERNITFKGGNITFGSQKATTEIRGNVTIEQDTNVTLRGAYYGDSRKTLDIKGNVTNEGNLTTDGSIINIGGNLTVESSAKLKAITNYSFNVSGLFDNKGDSSVSIARGGARFKDINNTKSLSITTNSSSTYSTVIDGNITNKKGSLNITNNGGNTEIQIGGNISQKEGNLTISSDKINITKRIEIKAGTDQGNSDSGVASNANLTIKTKELKLTENLNISGFDKAEIVAKENNNLIIGNNNGDNANAKTVTFNNVKDSKISANGHNVTLNSKVETSDGNSNTEGNSDNNAGLTINAKNVTVNKDITSNKTVNITASEKLTTKADATINATNGNVKVTTQTGDIKGQVKSTSGDVEITASGDTLKVSNITGQNVTVTANSGAITTTKGSTINATTGDANITTSTGVINGEVKSASGNVNITASGDTLNVSNVSGNAVTITADEGKLTTQAGSTVSATNGVTASSQSGDIGGTISGKTVSVTATTDSLTVKGSAKINATEGAATLTATKGTLTTAADSSISAASGILTINAKDAKLDGAASGNHTVVNATNASGSGSVTAKTSSSVNITGDLNTVNGLNIISK
ncbi:TPA: beta strand repeat-containing protein, partial [Haemophilus influenzae]